jgi:hypothetical protein
MWREIKQMFLNLTNLANTKVLEEPTKVTEQGDCERCKRGKIYKTISNMNKQQQVCKGCYDEIMLMKKKMIERIFID